MYFRFQQVFQQIQQPAEEFFGARSNGTVQVVPKNQSHPCRIQCDNRKFHFTRVTFRKPKSGNVPAKRERTQSRYRQCQTGRRGVAGYAKETVQLYAFQ